MSGALAELEYCTLAPEAVEPPAWVAPGEELWAQSKKTTVSVPGRYDRSEPCESQTPDEEPRTQVNAIVGLDFLPPRPRGLDLFRTAAACAAAADLQPSVLGRDLGSQWGMCLR